ncbi:MAG: nitrilase-related carbon-nitrogen hydrolase [Sporomusaceae bacterium]|nr:nitrilase-related carbon-nitrogen hydrolase [Sporomusaceae bacterium]
MIFFASLSAILFYFSTGFYDYWLLTWLAPLPLCLYSLQAKAAKTALASFVAFILGALNQFGYLPLLLFFSTTLLSATAFTLAILLFRSTFRSMNQPLAPLAFASAWTAYEFIQSQLSSLGTLESLAYTQVLNLPIIQLASVTGIWGITFLLMLLPASLAAIWHIHSNGDAWRIPALVVGGLLTIVVLFGFYRLYGPTVSPVMTIGLAAVPTTFEELRSQDPTTVNNSLQHYIDKITPLANTGAQLVLFPEKIAFLAPSAQATGLSLLSQAAQKNHVALVVGLSLQKEKLHNTALAFGPDGSLLDSYDKQHLLSPYENSYSPGQALTILPSNDTATAGLAICKDMDFSLPAMKYSQKGAGLLLVPALDFHTDGWLHARVAILRGVEGNFAVARAAQWGLLTVSDSRGRLLGTASTSNQGAGLVVQTPLSSGDSLYSRLGDWFAWLCLLGTAFTMYRLAYRLKSLYA